MADEPYENTLTIEQLRREVRRCWDTERELHEALRAAPELPSPRLLDFLSSGASWPGDWEQGNQMQRDAGLDAIPPVSECERGAGLWFRIRRGLLGHEEPRKP